tara:strand:- start:229 stop:471 length:243 start_codon:yes stop_codon:yes gene_type:complete
MRINSKGKTSDKSKKVQQRGNPFKKGESVNPQIYERGDGSIEGVDIGGDKNPARCKGDIQRRNRLTNPKFFEGNLAYANC